MKKIKVCHVASGFLRDDARIFIRQCGTLVNNGYDVTLLVNDGLDESFVDKIHIISHGYRPKGRLFDILFAKKYFIDKALSINADIYQLHGPELIPLGLKLKKLGKIIYYDAHEDLPRDILDKDSIPKLIRPILSILASLYLKLTLNKFDHIFTVTPHIVDRLRNFNKKVTLITNYPIVKNYTDLTLEEYLNRKNIICYTGTVYKYSNQENIISIINENDFLYYHIVGFIDEKFKEKLIYLSVSNSRISFIPKVSKFELNIILNSAIIGFVLYDYVRNLGFKTGSLGTNKLFEYMLAGLPIICTDFELWKEIIDKYNCGIYVQPNNKFELENAIKFLTCNKDKAFIMGQNGRNAILNEYNWKNEEIKYLKTFQI